MVRACYLTSHLSKSKSSLLRSGCRQRQTIAQPSLHLRSSHSSLTRSCATRRVLAARISHVICAGVCASHYQYRQRINNKRKQATTPMRAVAPTSLDISCNRRFISITFLRMPSKICFSSSAMNVIPVCVANSCIHDLAYFIFRACKGREKFRMNLRRGIARSKPSIFGSTPSLITQIARRTTRCKSDPTNIASKQTSNK
jgi:hypothetical protein